MGCPTAEPLVSPTVDPVVDPLVGALVCSVLDAPLWDGLTAAAPPVLCCALCSVVTLREVALAGWEEFELPRSACGAKPVLTADDFSTVVVSGWDVAWDVAAALTGVVVTGWLLTAPPVVTAAAFAEVFTGWLSAVEADENDGDKAGDPPVDRPEEDAPAEYGADEPDCTGNEWCSPAACLPALAVLRVESGSCCGPAMWACCSLPLEWASRCPSTPPVRF